MFSRYTKARRTNRPGSMVQISFLFSYWIKLLQNFSEAVNLVLTNICAQKLETQLEYSPTAHLAKQGMVDQ